MNKRSIVFGIIAGIVVIALAISLPKMWVNVNAEEIVVTQDPLDGELHVYFDAGLKAQNFGKVTHYAKEYQYWFSKSPEQGRGEDQSIKIRFNDGGHANLSGSVRGKNPLNKEQMIVLHTMYGSQEAIEQALVRTVIEKSVYMTGPLMSSKESYAEKRNDLISFISDQASNGVYKTTTKEVKGIDQLSGKDKTITVVALSLDKDGNIERQESSPLTNHGISLYNLSINSLDYDETVEAQIKSQQQAIMDVQTAMAEAKKAEQEAIKAEEQGKANAAKSKWAQEVIKAQMVTEAQQKMEVAELAQKAASFTKQEQIFLGQGEAERKRLVMAADGALEKKIDAWIESQKVWADAFSKYGGNVVPLWQNGMSGSSSNAVNDFMNLMNMQNAKSLGLDLSIQKK